MSSDSELRVQSAEQRALNAEEALQAALMKIQDLERHLQGERSLQTRDGFICGSNQVTS